MEKIWLKEYPKYVPQEVDLSEFESLKQVLERSCERFRDRPAYTNMGASITYGELDRQSRAFAAYLQQDLGLRKGDRVAIMMPNLLQYPVALFGTLRAGLTVVNVNPLYTPRELRHQLRDSGAKAIVVLQNFARTVQEVVGETQIKTVITTQIGDMLPAPKSWLVNFVVKRVKKMVPDWSIPGALDLGQVLKAGAGLQLADVPVDHDDVAFLQYTGGTTGVAKGAVLTHRNIIANLQQVSVWIGSHLKEGEETIVTALPLYHIFSLTVNCLVFTKWGANNLLITNPRDIPNFIKELKKTPFSVITGVNTLFNALLHHPEIGAVQSKGLKVAVGGGMAVQRAVAQKWQEVMGVPLIEGYGLTETSPLVCVNPLESKEFSGAIGLPVPSTEVSIRDESNKELGISEVGEICVRGPQVMKGYWNMPDETAKVMTPDGWFRTGDMGLVDPKGYVRITDRKKDLILVSGFNVYPNEVEDVVVMHPGVMECAAIGIPDAHSGEAVKVVVVRKDPNLTERELIDHCRKHLTGYKVPRHIEFRTEPLPKTNVGKVLRRMLRDENLAKGGTGKAA
ncbi:MAG TPA: long-chain-fatty-acid--CoA ligase [Burkholderiales bacterium]|nr:long-chain-fatty-acid--CoA ligase [Burkholderiales bacterium]